MPRLSVIVPVYNAEKYLEECVQSVLSQSFGDFELILVDDGSPDSSGKMCDAFAAAYSRVRVIHQENQGHITARMNGVKAAAGEYILFLDSDDYWFVDAFDKIDRAISSFCCDMLIFRHEKNGIGCPVLSEQACERLSFTEYMQHNIDKATLNSLVIRATKRVLFEGIDISGFAHMRNSEDMMLSLLLAEKAEKISVITDTLYFYRINPSGITNNYNPDIMHEFVASRSQLRKKLEQYGAADDKSLRRLNCAFLHRAADTALQISMNKKMNPAQKFEQYARIVEMPDFDRAYNSADLSALGAFKRIRVRLMKAHLYRLILVFDKVRLVLK